MISKFKLFNNPNNFIKIKRLFESSKFSIFEEENEIEEDISDFFGDLIENTKFEIDLDDEIILFEGKKSLRTDQEDIIHIGEEYNRVFKIRIKILNSGESNMNEDDIMDLKSGINYLSLKYELLQCESGGNNGSRYVSYTDIDPMNDLKVEDGEIKVNGSIVDDLYLFLKFDKIKISESDLTKYYQWSDYSIEDDKVFIYLSMEDLTRVFIPKSESKYKEILLDGGIIDRYFGSDYDPSLSELSGPYSDMDDDNKIKLANVIIYDQGGLEEFVKKNPNVYGIEKLTEMSIRSLIKRDNTHLLESIYKIGSDQGILVDEITSRIGTYRCDAHENQNYQEISDSFYNILNKFITYKDCGEKGLRIRFSYDWVEGSLIDIDEQSLVEIFYDWVDSIDYKFNPRLSDYGKVDSKELNIEISEIIESFKK